MKSTPYIQSNAHRQSGFTLVEMLVSLSIFTIVLVIAVGALLALVEANRKAQNLQLVMSNLNFALDHVTRTVSTGNTYHCENLTGNEIGNDNYTLPSGTDDCANGRNGLIVTDDKGRRVAYGYAEGQIFRKIDTQGWVPVTASEVVIEEAQFVVTGPSRSDDEQPFVTIGVKGYVEGIRDTDTDFDIQTSITQRILDN